MNNIHSYRSIFTSIEGVLRHHGYDAEAITPDADFMKDLGMDSLELTELVMQMEMNFAFSIPFELVLECKTVHDLTLVIEEQLHQSASLSANRKAS